MAMPIFRQFDAVIRYELMDLAVFVAFRLCMSDEDEQSWFAHPESDKVFTPCLLARLLTLCYITHLLQFEKSRVEDR